MAQAHSTSIIKTVISDDRLAEIIDKVCSKMLAPFKKEKLAADFWGAFEQPATTKIVSKSRARSERFGHVLEELVSLIARENDRFDVSETRKVTRKSPDGRITDIRIDCESGGLLLFVQSKKDTKNGAGSKQPKTKMSQFPNHQGIVAIVQGAASDRSVHKHTNMRKLTGPALFSFLTDGDDTLYDRINTLLHHWSDKHGCIE